MKNLEPKFTLTEKEKAQAANPEAAQKKIDIANEKLKMTTEEKRDESKETEMAETMEYARNKFSTLKDYIELIEPKIESWSLTEKEEFIGQIESLKKELLKVTGEESGKMIADLDGMKKRIVS